MTTIHSTNAAGNGRRRQYHQETNAALRDAYALNNMGVTLLLDKHQDAYAAAVTTFKDALTILQTNLQQQDENENAEFHQQFYQFRQERLKVASATVSQWSMVRNRPTTHTATPAATTIMSSPPPLAPEEQPPLPRPEPCDNYYHHHGSFSSSNSNSLTTTPSPTPQLVVLENNDIPSLVQAALSAAEAATSRSNPFIQARSSVAIMIREQTTTISTATTRTKSPDDDDNDSDLECEGGGGGALEAGIVLYNHGLAWSLLLASKQPQRHCSNAALTTTMMTTTAAAAAAHRFFGLAHDALWNAKYAAAAGAVPPTTWQGTHGLEISLMLLLTLCEARQNLKRGAVVGGLDGSTTTTAVSTEEDERMGQAIVFLLHEVQPWTGTVGQEEQGTATMKTTIRGMLVSGSSLAPAA
ncbi:hypothetical protein ACA910_020281 [Epithemia clementina (nom. ined.)]